MNRPVKNADLVKIVLLALVLLVVGWRVFLHHPQPPLPVTASVTTPGGPPPMKETYPLSHPHVQIIPPPQMEEIKERPKEYARDMPTWQKYALPFPDVPAGTPRIAVIIDDMGMDRVHTREAAHLPGPLTLSYMPYPPGVDDEVAEAVAAHQEILMHMPMEPVNRKLVTGDYFLTTEQSPAQLQAVLDRNLKAFTGYVGINNHMGSALTADQKAMDIVMKTLQQRGLLYVDSRTTTATVAAKTAAAYKIPQVSRDVFLDDDDSVAAVNKQLAEVERIAKKTGAVVAIGHPKAGTIEALRAWLPTLKDKGFALVPVSALVSVDGGSATSQPQSPPHEE